VVRGRSGEANLSLLFYNGQRTTDNGHCLHRSRGCGKLANRNGWRAGGTRIFRGRSRNRLTPGGGRAYTENMSCRILPLVAVVCLAWAGPVRADEYYFVVVFGAQSEPVLPRYTHSWATFVRLTGCGPDLNTYQMETVTISWMPATLDIRPFAVRPECGVNLDLHTSLRTLLANKEVVAQWGPYQSTPEVYRMALAQKARLESGQVLYKARDPSVGPRTRSVSNCIHALTDLEGVKSRLFNPTVLHFGHSASEYITRQFIDRGWLVHTCTRHDWLNARLGLTCYPICVRPLP
jgi:hypothetical protein